MITTQGKSGFFANNGAWIKPLIAALIFLTAPKVMQTLGGVDSGFLIPLCSVAAFGATVFAGFKARMTETLSAKIVSHVAVLACLFLVAVQFFKPS